MVAEMGRHGQSGQGTEPLGGTEGWEKGQERERSWDDDHVSGKSNLGHSPQTAVCPLGLHLRSELDTDI